MQTVEPSPPHKRVLMFPFYKNRGIGALCRSSATLDERFDRLSQQLMREIPMMRLKRNVPHMLPPAIECMPLANSFSLQ